ncbi:MAG: folate-binding protein [Elioraea sp.]|nr:folate-binding protein [Elioraea sp.]
MPIAELPARGVVSVCGPDSRVFLQGLVSNDVSQVAPGQPAVWAALLTPQGKWLADFFLIAHGERILLDCERGQASWLVAHLARYRLRARVEIADESDRWAVFAAWGETAPGGLAARDPRLPEAGWRRLAQPGTVLCDATEADYDRHRLTLGLPDGSRDLESGRTVLLEAGFDELNGISWTKGCWMGQELTARTKYRGLGQKAPRSGAGRRSAARGGQSHPWRRNRGWRHPFGPEGPGPRAPSPRGLGRLQPPSVR